MKEGKTLAQLASQIKHEREAKHDFRVPTARLHFSDEGTIGFKVKRDSYDVAPTRHCLRQICARSSIPTAYADRMADGHGALLAENINYWWRNAPEKRMLRTLLNGDQIARAFLSERYRPLENADLAAHIIPKLAQLECEVLSCEITETRLYIQAATPKIEAKLVGDVVRAGCVISNSEVGSGALMLEPLLYYLRCLNGMIQPRVMRRHHVGRRNDPDAELDAAAEYFTDATREQDDKAFWMKVKDVTDGLFDPARFAAMVEEFEGTTRQKIKGVDAVEEVTKQFKLVDNEKSAILDHLIEGGDLSLFGLINAVTRTASDVESYDRSIELQRIGGEIIRLPKSCWN